MLLINTLIYICGAILILSTALTCAVWYKYRHPLIKLLFCFWVTGILSFVSQGVFNNLETTGMMAFGTNWATVIFLLKIFSDVMDFKLPFRQYHILLGSSLLLSLILSSLKFPFLVSSGLFCLTCAGLLFHGALQNLRSEKNDFLANGYRLLLVFDGLHFLDYPLFRSNMDLAILGFSITLTFYFCFATFVPMFILRTISLDYTKKLQGEVDIRTRQLKGANEELLVAFQHLDSSHTKIGVMLNENQTRLSSVVHDLSNPLQILFVYLAMLIKDPTSFVSTFPEKIEKLQLAVKSVKQILHEAKNSHSENLGKSAASFQQIHLAHVIQDLLQIFEDKIQEKKLTVEIDFNFQSDYCVLADEAWLKNQILANLLSNAIKFSHRDGKIKISASQENNRQVCIRIVDGGTGIPPHVRNKLFEFNELTTSPGTFGELGTGLGLPIVKQYTKLIGGFIRIVDTNSKGTCFELLLQSAAPNANQISS